MIIFGRRRDRKTKGKSLRVTLASATFTYDGRIMVNDDGTLPIKTLCVNHDDRVCYHLVVLIFIVLQNLR